MSTEINIQYEPSGRKPRRLFLCPKGGGVMPRKPKRPCAYPGCPELTDDYYCDKHRKETNLQYERYGRDKETKKMYGARWRKIRALFVSQHPFCQQCLKENRMVPTEEVHHIVPLRHGGTHDEGNLMALCKSCHSRITAKSGDRWHNV